MTNYIQLNTDTKHIIDINGISKAVVAINEYSNANIKLYKNGNNNDFESYYYGSNIETAKKDLNRIYRYLKQRENFLLKGGNVDDIQSRR